MRLHILQPNKKMSQVMVSLW